MDVEILRKVALFEGMTSAQLRKLAAALKETKFPGSAHIFKEGEAGTSMFIIVEGKVRISREVPGMGEEALAVLGAGNVFGEMSLIDESPRSADAVVHERCRLLVLSKDSFEDLLFLHKDLAYEVLWNIVRMLTGRLRETNEKLTFLSVSGKF